MLFNPLTFLTLASAAIASPILDARQNSPDPNNVTINGITTSGTGCPQGTVGQFLSADRQVYVFPSSPPFLLLLLPIPSLLHLTEHQNTKYNTNINLRFTLIFDKYVAQIGPGIATTESRKFCQVNLQLHYPQGFQYSILKTIYRGFAQLDAGVTGAQEATYYFSGREFLPFFCFSFLPYYLLQCFLSLSPFP